MDLSLPYLAFIFGASCLGFKIREIRVGFRAGVGKTKKHKNLQNPFISFFPLYAAKN
jgi:hypothetical protein